MTITNQPKKPTPGAGQIKGQESVNAFVFVITSENWPGIYGLCTHVIDPDSFAKKLSASGFEFSVELYAKVEVLNLKVIDGIASQIPGKNVVSLPELEEAPDGLLFYYSNLAEMAQTVERIVTTVDCGRILSLGGPAKHLFHQDRIDACNSARTQQIEDYAKWDKDAASARREMQELVRDLAPSIAGLYSAIPSPSVMTNLGKLALAAGSALTAPIGIGIAGLLLYEKWENAEQDQSKREFVQNALKLSKADQDRLLRAREVLARIHQLGIRSFDELGIGQIAGVSNVVVSDRGNSRLSDVTENLIRILSTKHGRLGSNSQIDAPSSPSKVDWDEIYRVARRAGVKVHDHRLPPKPETAISASEKARESAMKIAVAVKSIQRSAADGDRNAQYALGGMYFKGDGVPKDVVLACAWLNVAATFGHLKEATEDRDRLLPKLSTEEQKEIRLLTSQWKKGMRLAREGAPFGTTPPEAGEIAIVTCPKCSQRLRVPAHMTLEVRCPKCDNRFLKKT